MIELQAKLQKYEGEAVDCERLACLATNDSQRNLYERLALHYRELAADFRKAITTRNAA